MGAVKLPLLPFHMDIHAFLQLVRQIRKHILFQPPQDKGAHHFLQLAHSVFILALHCRGFDLRPEALIAIEESRHQVVKNTPQLAEPVFDGRSR